MRSILLRWIEQFKPEWIDFGPAWCGYTCKTCDVMANCEAMIEHDKDCLWAATVNEYTQLTVQAYTD